MKGRIKVGAIIFQDHRSFIWPDCKPPQSEYVNKDYDYIATDPDMVFDVERTGHHWNCKALGYGIQPDYGNGSIFVSSEDGVVTLEENTKDQYEDIEIGKDLIMETLTQIDWSKTRSHYHVRDDKQSPYWMEKMLQAKAKLQEALDILERIR